MSPSDRNGDTPARIRFTRDYQAAEQFSPLDVVLMAAFLVAMPIVLAAAAYAFMWVGLCLVRFIPLIGRKHRHPDWDRLNK